MGRVVGIDLGTTNSAVAVAEGSDVTIITTSEGTRLPSVVAFSYSGERLTGRPAREQAANNPENTIFAVKRLLGRSYDDPEVNHQHPQFACSLRPGPRGDVRIHVPAVGKVISPQEVAAQLLARIRHEAEAYLGDIVHDAVISVPAYFGETQRQAVKDAATIAGLRVRQVINEPTAVALNYGLAQNQAGTIMVIDLGGGTYDVSILDVGDGEVAVRASSGDTRLGGSDWDSLIVSWLVDGFLRQEAIDLRRERQAMQRIREAAEQAKILLSTEEETEINLPFIATSSDGPRHLHRRLTRMQLEAMAAPLLARLTTPLQRALVDAGLGARALDAVILVGGATPMPMVRRTVAEVTGVTPQTPPQPEQAVVRGAALHAAALAGEIAAVRVHDVTPLSLGLETAGSMMSVVVPRNTPIPVRRSQVFSTSEDDQTAVEIHVLQGERPMAPDNETLGVFRLEGIPASPRGIPQIEVDFTIDENGLLNVSARELISGTSQTVTLTTTTSLSATEVAQMVREAERCAAVDIKQRNLVEARMAARQILYLVERHRRDGTKNENGNGYLLQRIAELREALEGKDAASIRRLAAEVQQISATAPETA